MHGENASPLFKGIKVLGVYFQFFMTLLSTCYADITSHFFLLLSLLMTKLKHLKLAVGSYFLCQKCFCLLDVASCLPNKNYYQLKLNNH